ncbi:hypothetical protein FFLO_05740 [Filobasidium floriforme]|uniref:GP-PDE domain-containing protein n=1 Tax=Filobasidium floriforme TaxID=5210 RepID=A0A8K0JG99_9TREE|nr:hypothetical protein FFLO_05740 [Filobasidium floriforme]
MKSKAFLKNALDAGKPGIGMWLTMRSSFLAHTLATVPGFNWLLVDAEHGQITDSDIYDLCNTITNRGISPIVRIPSDESWMIKRALDSGASGIMTPMCHTADAARAIVASSKFAPQGTRGCGSPFTHTVFSIPARTYELECNNNLLVIVQIESRSGVENVQDIAAVDGVDVLFVGPFDLAKSMDIEFGGKEHEDAIAKTLKACKDNQKYAAIFCSSGEIAKKRLDQGFDMVSICTDTGSLVKECTAQVQITLGQ